MFAPDLRAISPAEHPSSTVDKRPRLCASAGVLSSRADDDTTHLTPQTRPRAHTDKELRRASHATPERRRAAHRDRRHRMPGGQPDDADHTRSALRAARPAWHARAAQGHLRDPCAPKRPARRCRRPACCRRDTMSTGGAGRKTRAPWDRARRGSGRRPSARLDQQRRSGVSGDGPAKRHACGPRALRARATDPHGSRATSQDPRATDRDARHGRCRGRLEHSQRPRRTPWPVEPRRQTDATQGSLRDSLRSQRGQARAQACREGLRARAPWPRARRAGNGPRPSDVHATPDRPGERRVLARNGDRRPPGSPRRLEFLLGQLGWRAGTPAAEATCGSLPFLLVVEFLE